MLSKTDKNGAFKDRTMSDAARAQRLFREAFPDARHGSVKSAIYAGYLYLSRRVTKQFTERRARSLHEGKARRVDAEEIDALNLALIEEGRRERIELRNRLAALDEKLARYEATSAGQTSAG